MMDKLTITIGRVALGSLMMFVASLQLLNLYQFENRVFVILLIFGGIGTIMWGLK